MRQLLGLFVKNLRLVGIAVALIVVVLAVSLQNPSKAGKSNLKTPKNVASASSGCGPYRSDKTVQIGSAVLKAEVPKTSAAARKGLSGRPCIEANQGMLFVFNKPGHYAFWMKDMRFPIDIIWISTDHKVVGIEQDVQPSTYPDHFINKDQLAQYVLELQANRSASLNINLGTQINF